MTSPEVSFSADLDLVVVLEFKSDQYQVYICSQYFLQSFLRRGCLDDNSFTGKDLITLVKRCIPVQIYSQEVL